MRFALRFLAYVVGGGALLAWINPGSGLLEALLLLAYIVAAAYLDDLLRHGVRGQARHGQRAAGGTVALSAFRERKRRAGQGEKDKPERRHPQRVYSSALSTDAERLANLLRSQGLSPVMVTERGNGAGAPIVYEVRLPEHQVRWGKPLISQFLTPKAQP